MSKTRYSDESTQLWEPSQCNIVGRHSRKMQQAQKNECQMEQMVANLIKQCCAIELLQSCHYCWPPIISMLFYVAANSLICVHLNNEKVPAAAQKHCLRMLSENKDLPAQEKNWATWEDISTMVKGHIFDSVV